MILCLCVHIPKQLMVSPHKLYMSPKKKKKKTQNSRKELGVRGLKQQPTYLLNQRGWTESQS